MDKLELLHGQYASFLVRLWRSGEPKTVTSASSWQGEVEHIQSGQRLGFTSPAELWEFLRQPRDLSQEDAR